MKIDLQNLNTFSPFYARWVAARHGRDALADKLAKKNIAHLDFEQLSKKQGGANISLPQRLRRLRNAIFSSLARRDLVGAADLSEVLSVTSKFADFTIQSLLDAITLQMQDDYGVPMGVQSKRVQKMIVIGMGKLGGEELNVSSDIDLIFVYPEDGDTLCSTNNQRSLSNQEFFIRLARKLIASISEINEEGFIFRVDMALRPNGNSGPLVCSFNMLENYLIIQGREWERYAWIKARAITGEDEDISALSRVYLPFVYRRYLDFGVIDALRTMHGQIRAEVVRQEKLQPQQSNNIKLGRGGIREIEFVTQVFQLIRGGRELDLRECSTRKTLKLLEKKQLLDGKAVADLLKAYEFLRNLEHRLQYREDAQTHSLPNDEKTLQLIANTMDFETVDEFRQVLMFHRTIVAKYFDAIFQEKHSDEKAQRFAASEFLVSERDINALAQSLAVLGFQKNYEAANRLHTFVNSSRLFALSDINRNRLHLLIESALPIIIACEADAYETLSRVLDFFEAIAGRSAYLALLQEHPIALQRLIRVASFSEWTAHYLTRHPILLDELIDGQVLRNTYDWKALRSELNQQIECLDGDTERQMIVLREFHHAQLFRLLLQDLEGLLSVEYLADHLSELADLMVASVIDTIWNALPDRHRKVPQFAVIAYGKLGGKELGYASDLDLIFMFDDDHPDAPFLYAKLAQRFITWMTCPTAAGILFDIDTALRPDGASGIMVSSLAAFSRYQAISAWTWEHQALTRARFCTGFADLGVQFEAIRHVILMTKRDPENLKRDILAMREKMRSNQPVRSAVFDLKHGLGGMIDIEFMVQYLVLRYAHDYPQLTANLGNIALLRVCGELGLISDAMACEVANTYRDFRRLQHLRRLKGLESADLNYSGVEKKANAVHALWTALFSTQSL